VMVSSSMGELSVLRTAPTHAYLPARALAERMRRHCVRANYRASSHAVTLICVEPSYAMSATARPPAAPAPAARARGLVSSSVSAIASRSHSPRAAPCDRDDEG
jgi:hypothetical protein